MNQQFYLKEERARIEGNFSQDHLNQINRQQCKKQAKRVSVWRPGKPWLNASFLCNNCDYKFKAAIALKKFYDRVEVKKKVFESSKKSSGNRKYNAQEKNKKPVLKTK